MTTTTSALHLLNPSTTALIRPALALASWTFVMECWLYATRIPAISKYNVRTDPDATYADFNAHIPRSIQWKAENYNHLHEQPTVFYAVVLALAVQQLGGAERDDSAVTLAWGYVGVRYVSFGAVLVLRCAACLFWGRRVLICVKTG